MAGVRVLTGPPLDTPIHEINDTRTAQIHAGMRMADIFHALHADCRKLPELLDECERAGWMGYAGRNEFIHGELKWPPARVDLALAGLDAFDLTKPVTLDAAVGAAERMREAVPGPGQGYRSDLEPLDNIKKSEGGTGAAYLAARIKRDRPDIAEAVERGEYRSMRAAAIDAGIVKPPCPVRAAQNAVRKMSDDQLAKFVAWMEGVE